ncbi:MULTISPECIES: molecular chaperone [unclassified Paraburkholderia]|uniref:fimbrial biogenesis chaperone n=1 Tax=unclassified Paraburkholderia TaxID=2615204 RepID=UPI0016116F10|nr:MULTISPECIES: molecular chaperone [unclassified Paraburkholderia]MBB5445119.1 fimbrial chaperone protein [Paraburkholderia sp. WSM4177]MBB5485667.1 fimbrial chaperone protein [Paraburkholderia sp. WSM4180]
MNTGRFHSLLSRLCAAIALATPLFSDAAVVPDRTRLVFDEGAQAASVTVTNKSAKYPYLIQSWIEDENGKKITAPFMVLPPLQRIEANDRNVLRVVLLPGNTLPTDRESVFYLNIREIPPTTEAVNALQIALHSKLKLFYRPKNVQPKRNEDPTLPMTVKIDSASHKLTFDNPTPLHVSIVELHTGEKKAPVAFDSVMVDPMNQTSVPFKEAAPTTLYVTHMNDYGGQTEVKYACEADTCRSVQQ